MPDPAAQYFLGVPGYACLWLVTLVTFALFSSRVFSYIGILAGARGENRWDHPARRLGLILSKVLGQKRLFHEPIIGVAHFIIFWAFVFYAAAFFWNLLRGLFPFVPIPYADAMQWMAVALEVFGVAGLAAIVVAATRRYLFTPPRLERSWDASLILLWIAIVLLSALGLTGASTPVFYLWMWWTHMVAVLGFLAYLPYSKHLHLLASPFSVFFASLQPGSMPASSEGAFRREEFTWRQLFNGLACAECGRCDRACPAFNSGYPLSPKMLIHQVKQLVRTARPADEFVGGRVKREEIWACATCSACMEQCPVFNEHIPLLIEMRRYLVAHAEVEHGLQETLEHLNRYGNSFGSPPRVRSHWMQGLDFAIQDARKQPVEYLWFVGDYASFDPRVQPLTRATARVFRRAGLDFGILYDSEQNSGNDVRRVGEEGLFEMLRDRNLKMLGRVKFQKIVTTDPHTYHALKNEYGWNSGTVCHYAELLDSLVASGKLPVRNKPAAALTYHDPCYLGRYNGVYRSPRRVLRALGARLVEMPRNRASAYCCGAGGGRIWMEDVPGIRERPAENRVREAASLDSVSVLAVACPKDFVMFHEALQTAGLESRLRVTDLAQLVEEAIG